MNVHVPVEDESDDTKTVFMSRHVFNQLPKYYMKI
jgi:hypothetical protein